MVAAKGYSASKVEIVNSKTGGTEIVKLINCDLDDFLGPGETEVSSNKHVNVLPPKEIEMQRKLEVFSKDIPHTVLCTV